MSEQEKKIMETCGKLVPLLTEVEKEKFLSFTEGMAFLTARLTCDSAPERK
ncbi:MAG: hypothetical protein HFG07_08565 [Oscillibacter sp.]|jgi:hypothetical protein|nr:hypothetical protein [Lawsonibacter sp.]MCI9610247.1 hypothetical protein [Oscillibacter sp.]